MQNLEWPASFDMKHKDQKTGITLAYIFPALIAISLVFKLSKNESPESFLYVTNT